MSVDFYLDSAGDAKLVKIDDGDYPVSIRTAVGRSKEHAVGEKVPVSLLTALGYAVVTPTVKPDEQPGKVVVESAPILQEDTYYQNWQVRDLTAEEINADLQSKKTTRMGEISRLMEAAKSSGMPYDFGGEYGVQHVQLRDGDRTNITGLKIRADDNSGGQFHFRTYENNLIVMTAPQIEQMASAAFEGFTELMGVKWVLENQVLAANTVDVLPSLPESLWDMIP